MLEKSPYKQQALHACKLYLVAAPNASDAGDMQQRIAGLQYAADRDKAQMKQRTAYIKPSGLDDLYRFGGISKKSSWQRDCPEADRGLERGTSQISDLAACLQNDVCTARHTIWLAQTNRYECAIRVVNMHLLIKPEGEGLWK